MTRDEMRVPEQPSLPLSSRPTYGWELSALPPTTAPAGTASTNAQSAAMRARAGRMGGAIGTSTATIQSLEGTYGGDQVSTWSVLRQSCKPRSPVGLVNPPANQVSAKNEHLALAA